MITATEHADEFFTQLCLSDDGLGYPNRVFVVAVDVENVAAIVWRALDDEDRPVIVIDAAGGATLVTPPSRFERLLDRVRGCRRVWVEARGNGAGSRRVRTDRATVERDLLASVGAGS